MASIGLGWIGEPALVTIVERIFEIFGIAVSSLTAHTLAITAAFILITAIHIVLGELAPKTVALQYPE